MNRDRKMMKKLLPVATIFLLTVTWSVANVHAESRSLTHFSMGYYYLYNDDLKRALDQFELSFLHAKDPPAALYAILAEVANITGDREYAEKYGLMAVRIDPEIESALRVLSLIYIDENKYDLAMPYLEKLVEIEPDNLQALFFLAEAYNAIEEEDKLIGVYGKILLFDPESVDIALNLGYLYTKRGAFSLAKNEFERVLKIEPDNERALFYLTYIYLSTGDTEEALEIFKKLDNKNLLKGETLEDYAKGLFIEGQNPAPVLQRIENWEAVSPVTKGIRLFWEGNLEEARVLFDSIISEDPNNITALNGLLRIAEERRDPNAEKKWRYMLAGSLYGIHQYEKSRKESERVKQIDHEHLENRYLLGDIYSSLGLTDKAIEEYEYYVQNAEDKGDVYIKLGISHDEMGNHEEAIRSFRSALEYFPQNDELFYFLGIEYRIIQDYQNAVDALQRAIGLNDNNARYYFHLGVSYERLGMIEDAIQHLHKSVQLDDSSASALNYLGYLLADGNVRLQEARRYIEKALTIDPDNGAYLDSMGWVYFKLSEYDKARTYLEDAIKYIDLTDEENYVIYEHLGDVYYKIGLIEKAVEAWHEALNLKYSEIIQNKINRVKTEVNR
jgi:tetratricopeptide (TPR) repeat protein